MSKSELPDWLANKIQLASGGCWIYTGWKTKAGYGRIDIPPGNKTKKLVHVLVWEILIGPVVNELHHTCPRKSCCNPAHLKDLTSKEHGKHHRRIEINNEELLKLRLENRLSARKIAKHFGLKDHEVILIRLRELGVDTSQYMRG